MLIARRSDEFSKQTQSVQLCNLKHMWLSDMYVSAVLLLRFTVNGS